ncbi:MAG TPA: site-2 protease family protein [Hyphomicrobiaceae bacterium]|nr:site-2 protease family protein [Hyphomicrobiaceae bacterium]
MGGSFTLFHVGGTAVRIHPTFFLLLGWVAVVHWMQGGPQEALSGVLFIAILFVCVVLHEFGHILAAARYGIKTPDVTLLPIGGVASLERMPEKPAQEIVVALAGPAVNLLIAAVLVIVIGVQFDMGLIARLDDVESSLIARVAAANVALLVFNLIPAFPMDGGRVLRALLALPLGYARATQVAALIGQGIAILFGFLGLLGNPFLVLIAVFIFLAASAEAGYVQARDLTRGYLASDAMITSFQSLGPMATADDAATLLLRTTQQEFPVLDGGGRLRGMLTRRALIEALKERGGETPVLEIMNANVPTVRENACLDSIYQTLTRAPEGIVGVLDREQRFVGYISTENLSEMVMIRSSRAVPSRARTA